MTAIDNLEVTDAALETVRQVIEGIALTHDVTMTCTQVEVNGRKSYAFTLEGKDDAAIAIDGFKAAEGFQFRNKAK